MDDQDVFVSYGSSPNNPSFVVVPIGDMTFLLKGDAQELWFVSCHVLGASTIQVPLLMEEGQAQPSMKGKSQVKNVQDQARSV